MKKLRIAQLSTPWERVPPPKYGGTELIVSHLTEELVRRGHQVTLFATGDAITSAKLVSVFPKALYRAGIPWSDYSWSLLHAQRCFEMADQFDIIHNHFNYFGLSFGSSVETPVVTTYHGDFETAEKNAAKRAILEQNRHMPFVSISNDQRKHAKTKLHFVGTVYNAIKVETFGFSSTPGNYLVWLGRITKKKGILEAIAVAKRAKMKLKIAAKIDPFVDKPFYDAHVKPLIDGKQIEYVGEIGHAEKSRLLKNAYALINPITWNEPFGLVMVESMACGTPVIAFPRGAAPELVKHNVTGFLTPNIEGMVKAIKKIPSLSRTACRVRVEKYFSVSRMVDGYEAVYKKIIG